MASKLFVVVLLFLLASCASQTRVDLFTLDVPVASKPPQDLLPVTLVVGRPSVLPGYDTPRMAYVTRPHQIDYFSRNQWVDSPAKMLHPILVEALSRRFKNVVNAPSPGDMQLDTEIVLLRQEFSGNSSRIHFVLRALIHRGGQAAETREFEIFEACPENNPYGGVVAANQAVSALMHELSDYCASLAPIAVRH